MSIKINLNNRGIAKAAELIAYEELDPVTLNEMKMENSRKTVLNLTKEEGRQEGLEEGLQKGMEKGLEEGLQKGIQTKAIEMAKKMIKAHRPISEIVEFTELPIETVENLVY